MILRSKKGLNKTYVGGNLKEKLPIIPFGSSENLKVRQLRSAKPISLGYWYSRMYHKPMNCMKL